MIKRTTKMTLEQRIAKLERLTKESRSQISKNQIKRLFADCFQQDILEKNDVLVGLDKGYNLYTLSIEEHSDGILEVIFTYHDIEDGTKCSNSTHFILDSEEAVNEFEYALGEID